METLPLKPWHITIKVKHPTRNTPIFWDTVTQPMTFDQALLAAIDHKETIRNNATISALYEIGGQYN